MDRRDRLDERISKDRWRISHLTSGALTAGPPPPREPADMSLNLHAEHTRGTSPQQRRSCPFSSPSRWILVGSVRIPRPPRALVSIPWAPQSSSAKRFQHSCGCVVAILPGSRLPGDRWYPLAFESESDAVGQEDVKYKALGRLLHHSSYSLISPPYFQSCLLY